MDVLALMGQDEKACRRDEGLDRARQTDICPLAQEQRQDLCLDLGRWVSSSYIDGFPKPTSPFRELLVPNPVPQSWDRCITKPGSPKSIPAPYRKSAGPCRRAGRPPTSVRWKAQNHGVGAEHRT